MSTYRGGGTGIGYGTAGGGIITSSQWHFFRWAQPTQNTTASNRISFFMTSSLRAIYSKYTARPSTRDTTMNQDQLPPNTDPQAPKHLKPLRILRRTPEQITQELKLRAAKVKKRIARLERLKHVSTEVMRMRCCV